MDDEAVALRRLRTVAAAQDAVVTARDLAVLGLPAHTARRMVRRGEWVPLLRGSHLVDPARTGDRLARSWARSAALTVPGAVAGLTTAASLHGIEGAPTFDGAQVVLPARLSKRPRAHLEPHAFVLARADIVELRGVPATSAVRTVADLVPRLGRLEALAVMDSALRTGILDRTGLAAAKALARGRRGSLAVDDLWDLADGLAETPLESRVRLRCIEGGLVPDALQVRLHDDDGVVVARGDIGFRRRSRPGRGWLILEADGRGPHDAPKALYRDRSRANALVALDHDLLRCTWFDTADRHTIPDAVRAAL